MFKKILSYGFIEGIAKGLNKLILLLLPFFLDTKDFGKVGLLISLELLLPFITLLGLERVVLRFYHSVEKFSGFNRTIFTTILYTHILATIIFTAFYVFGIKDFFGLNIFPDIYLLILLVYLQGRNQVILNTYRVSEQHKKYFKSRLILQVGKFFLVLGLVYLTKSYLAYIIGGIIIGIIINIYHSNRIIEEKFDYDTFKYFFLFSWPFVFHGIAGNLLGNADRFILADLLSLNEVGLYTFASSIGSMMVFAFVGVSVYMEPILYKAKNLDDFNIKLNKFLMYTLFSGLVALFFIIVLSEYIIGYIYPEYLGVIKYIPLISLSYIFYPFYLSSNYRLIYTKKTSSIALLSVATSTFNVILNYIFIPHYGIIAAVAVTFISYMVQATVFIIYSNRGIFTSELWQIFAIGGVVVIFTLLDINSLVILGVVSVLIVGIYRKSFILKQE